jgi:hypothetical protein
VEREAMGLGFGAGEDTVWLENGDGGKDGDYLRFYVAITLPQMPLSEIDGVVNLFSARRAKERHLIFGTCWQDCLGWCEIKFSRHVGGTTQHTGSVLCRDRNLFRVLIGNDYDKMLLT